MPGAVRHKGPPLMLVVIASAGLTLALDLIFDITAFAAQSASLREPYHLPTGPAEPSRVTLPSPSIVATQETRMRLPINARRRPRPTRPPQRRLNLNLSLTPSALLYEPEGHDHLAADFLDHTNLLPLTAEFQRELFRTQHPSDCATARFLVVNTGHNGMGSDLHVAGHHLMTAYTHGYVFLWGNSSGSHLIVGDPERLCPNGALNYECFFRAPSNCTLDDAIDWEVLASASSSTTPSSSPLPAVDDAWSRPRSHDPLWMLMRHSSRRDELPLRSGSIHANHVLAQALNIYNDNLQRTLPGTLIDRLRSLGLGDFEIRSWIRAQSVGYLARFNDETLAAVRASRLNTTTHGYFETEEIPGSGEAAPRWHGLPLPLLPGSISAHVRHGDKWKEMSLVPEMRYLDAAVRLISATQHAKDGGADSAEALRETARQFRFSAAVGVAARMSPPLSAIPLASRLFVSTEDPGALTNLQAAGATRGWQVAFSRIPRVNDGPLAQALSVEAGGEGRAAVRLVRMHLGQLLLALEADAWVGTYASNWNRLIDELRAVWVPKMAGPFIEVGEVHDYQVW